MHNLEFYNPTRGKLDLQGLICEIVDFISQNPHDVYKLSIGSDSESSENPVFITALTIHRVGRGARFFVAKFFDRDAKFSTLRQRIYQETMLSLNFALKVWPMLEEKIKEIYPLNHNDVCIHLDVGNKGETRAMIKEIVGMIRGNGFEAEIKPDAYAAFVVADRYA